MNTRQIPIVVSGGLDTKTNPKLVKPGAALQIDNMFQQRPGEWRVRNGMTTQPATFSAISAAPILYPSPGGGGVSAVARGLSSAFADGRPAPARYGTRGTGLAGWEGANTNTSSFPFPSFACQTDALFGDSGSDIFDGDVALMGTFRGAVANNAGAKFSDATTGRIDEVLSAGWATPRMCSTTNYMAAVGLSGSGPFSIQLSIYGANGSLSTVSPASLSGVVATATPWFDVVASPATDTVVIAYSAAAGGVSLVLVDLSTASVTVGPTNYVGVDASMALALIVGPLASNSVTLLTAGTGGIIYHPLAASTLVISSHTSIDGTATANVRQLTGHWDSAAQITALWEVPGTSRLFDAVKRGRWTGSGTATITLAPSFSLYSRTAQAADGKWYFVGAYDSPTQPSYALLTVDAFLSSGNARAVPACQVMTGEGAGRRAAQSDLTSLVTSGSSLVCALPRKKKVTVAGVSAFQGRILQLATFSDITATASRPRELGGVTFLPGGFLYADDGQSCRTAVFPRYPEPPTLAGANIGGGMTASKSYGYRLVLRRQDNAGRIVRSAGSVPVTVTLGAGDNAVALTIPNPYIYWTDFGGQSVIEVYRNGPIEDGKNLYNRVATQSLQSFNADTVLLNDAMSDANAAFGEPGYFTGNVEENTVPPATSLLEVNGGRVWIANAEDPTELWYSKQSKAGALPGFTGDFTVRLDGDGRGPITALGSMDSRIIAFKDGAIWAAGGGDGPSDVDQGSFPTPQLLSRETGVPAGLARSVVAVPDGLMFQSARGIYLLDRGIGLTYIGAPVEAYTQAANVVDASTVRGATQARFLMASGRCLVWDYQAKTWSTFLLPVGGSTVVACADTRVGWFYVTADGKLRAETAGATNDDGAAIIPVISLPHLDFAGLSGYQRLKSLDLLFDVLGTFTLSVDAEFNYSGALTGAPRTIAVTPATPTAQAQYLPPDGMAKCTSMRPVITVQGAPTDGTFRLTSVTATVGIKSGSHLVDSQKMS